jgi:flagellar hook-basal body complex protein FliE
MVSSIHGIGAGMAAPELGSATPSSSGGDFHSVFDDAVRRVDDYQKNAAQSIDKLMSGESEEVHQTILSAQRAELSLEFFLQMKNKAVQAYQEIMRMQL